MKLTGQRNQCPSCGQYFKSTSAFDKHRTGEFGVNRRCRTVPEMEAAGMVCRNGWWVGAANSPFWVMAEAKDATSRAGGYLPSQAVAETPETAVCK